MGSLKVRCLDSKALRYTVGWKSWALNLCCLNTLRPPSELSEATFEEGKLGMAVGP